MLQKYRFFTLLFCLIILLPVNVMAQFWMSPRKAIMDYAKRGNIYGLRQMIAKGYQIDMYDEKGNSALCEAVWRKDQNAVANLIKVGANLNNECMKKIPPEYKQAVGIRSIGAQGTASGTQAAGTAVATETEAGLSTGAMVGIGIGAAALIGGGAALAAGGGGGVSSKSTPLVCVHGTLNEDKKCSCDTGWAGKVCDTCDTGYGLYGTTECYADQNCDVTKHLHQEGNTCVCDDGYPVKYQGACYDILECVHGEQQGSSCVCVSKIYTGSLCNECVANYIKDGSECKPCQNGGTSNMGSETECSCPDGWKGDKFCNTKTQSCSGTTNAIPASHCKTTVVSCASGDDTLYSCSECADGWAGDEFCNTKTQSCSGTTNAIPASHCKTTVVSCASGDDILYSCSECADGWAGDEFCNSKTSCSGTTEEITHCLSGNVEICKSGDDTLYRSCLECAGNWTGIETGCNICSLSGEGINLETCECASDYSLDQCPANGDCSACTEKGGTKYKFNGCVSGYISTVDGKCNAKVGANPQTTSSYSSANVNLQEEPGENVTITINVSSASDEDVDTLYGIRFNAPSNSMVNAYNSNGEGAGSGVTITGNIVITNTNEKVENIYGMYRPYDSEAIQPATIPRFLNAYSTGSTTIGKINITNIGDSNVVGISGYYAGNAVGVGATGLVTIVNTGDGNITGIEGLYNTVMNGVGTINITNDGNGDIIGHYGLRNGCGGATGTIMIDNIGGGSVIGHKGHFNSCKRGYGKVDITSTGSDETSSIYGLFMGDNKYSSEVGVSGTPESFIRLANAYGAYAGSGYSVRKDKDGNDEDFAKGIVKITHTGVYGTVYGMYNNTINSMYNAMIDSQEGSGLGADANSGAKGFIDITRNATLDDAEITIPASTFGMYSSNPDATLYNVYGSASSYSNLLLSGDIRITQNTRGNVYGVYSAGDFVNTYLEDGFSNNDMSESVEGYITLVHNGSDVAVGIYGKKDITLLHNDSSVYGRSPINIINNSTGSAVGVYKKGEGNLNVINSSEINISSYNNKAGDLIGVYADGGSSVIIDSTVEVEQWQYPTETEFYAGNVYGIYAVGDGTTVHNVGKVSVKSASPEGNVIGIYAGSGTTVENTGEIEVMYSCCSMPFPAYLGANIYGIYAEPGATVINKGTINILGRYIHDDSEVENGQKDASLSVEVPVFKYLCSAEYFYAHHEIWGPYLNPDYDPDSSASDNFYFGTNISFVSHFELDEDGNLQEVSDVYVAKEEETKDAYYWAIGQEGLTPSFGTLDPEAEITSVSSLDFNIVFGDGVKSVISEGGSYEADVIKGALYVDNEVVQNGFKDEYVLSEAIQASDTSGLNLISQSALFDASLENGTDIVMKMKKFDEVVENKSLASFLEKNYELGNNEAFFNDIKGIGNASAFKSAMNSLTGQDTIARFGYEDLTAMRELNLQMNDKMFANDDKQIYETQGNMTGFSFKNDNHSSANYALATKRIAPRWKIGYAMSNTTLNTDDDNDTTRRSSIFGVFMPIGYENRGWKLISTPQISFQRSHYTRQGYNDTSYKGIIERRTVALMNEARYPIDMRSFTLTPTVEFNAIAYNQKGGEENKAYALTMPSDNNLSVEAGIGLKASKAFGDWKLDAGLMMYREFADPYNVKMGMQGMDGTFNLYDDNREYRGVATFGFDYDVDAWNIYGKVQHFIEADTHTNMKAGIRYNF